LVDYEWEATRLSSIVAYLRSGVRINRELGYSYCRFKNGPPDYQMGDSDLTDGVWVWPQGLPIYVERFHVRLPDEFIRHMEKNSFTVPGGLDSQKLEMESVDFEFWKVWCKREKRKNWKRLFWR
jgi:hypothetical protein